MGGARTEGASGPALGSLSGRKRPGCVAGVAWRAGVGGAWRGVWCGRWGGQELWIPVRALVYRGLRLGDSLLRHFLADRGEVISEH